MNKQRIIYLDNSATTPVDQRVLQEMLPYFSQEFGNASSLHFKGQMAMLAVEKAKKQISNFLDCSADDIYFTSGATESNNWVIKGIVKNNLQKEPDLKPHLIVSAIEHESILEPVKQLVKDKLIEITYLKVNQEGIISPTTLKEAIKDNTVLVSLMLANNEIGSIQPISEIAKIIKEINANRNRKVLFHSDATQALAYLDCRVEKLGVDFLSFSAHKIYGPKGIGALYIRQGIKLEPLIAGGGQQKGQRSGTYNVAGIVGFGKAVEIIADKQKQTQEIKRLRELRNYLIKQVLKKISKVSLNGSLKYRLPNNVNFTFQGVEGESIILMLSQKGICASTGSACSSKSLEPSHVLLALGIPPEQAHGSLRLTLGRFTKKSDIDILLKHLPVIIEKLRSISPLKI